MHHVKRYVGYLIALAVIIAIVRFITTLEIKGMPPGHDQMAPKIKPEDWIWMHKRDRGVQGLNYNDVVRYVFRHSTYDDAKEVFLGRVIGKPGDRIAMREGKVFRAKDAKEIDFKNASPISENYLDPNYLDATLYYHGLVVPRDHVFLLVDNRKAAVERHKSLRIFHADSRFFGPIPAYLIIGTIDVD